MSDCSEYNGILCLYKPRGFTSFDAVAKLRGIFGIKRIGHGGTLDPLAEGVLPVFLGRACQACDILPESEKVYKGSFRLGVSSDTQDITGTLSEKKDFSFVDETAINNVLNNFRGEIMQLPPMYSAVSVNGKRLYELARKGETVERKPRKITIYSIELLSYDRESGEGQLLISCSKGTYIRTVINDMGEVLGTGAVMTALIRTKSCGLDISEAVTFETLQGEKERSGDLSRFVTPVSRVFAYLPKIYLTPCEERLYRNGVRLEAAGTSFHGSGTAGVYGSRGFIGTADVSEGLIKCGKTFDLREVKKCDGYAVALGIFDGVHKGHRKVIAEAVKTAEENGLEPSVFTFQTDSVSGDTKKLFSSCILDEEEKLRRIRQCGIENIFSPPFEQFRDLSSEEFVRNVLKRRMNVSYVICGEDFRCGRGAECGTEELSRICGKYGIAFKTVALLPDSSGEKISSGRIRELISQGRVSEAAQLMEGRYTVNGTVINGRHLGRTLGFPTVNQKLPPFMQMPKFGVYSSEVRLFGRSYRGLSNIGIKPTVSDSGEVLCETYIFDFDSDAYGAYCEVSLIDFIRSERKFSSAEELKIQILSDIDKIRKVEDQKWSFPEN